MNWEYHFYSTIAVKTVPMAMISHFAQDVIRCDVCPDSGERDAAEIVCRSCRKNLCQVCVAKHVLSSRREHAVIQLSTIYRRAKTMVAASLVQTVPGGFKPLSRVVKSRDGYLWTSGDMNVIKKININGVVMETHSTGSIHAPFDIALNNTGDLLFTVMAAKELNVIRGQRSVTLVKITDGWTPRGLCSTAKNEVLLSMFKSGAPDKVVRYSGPRVIQEISHDSSGSFIFKDASFVCENGNYDVCVSDVEARCVVVLNSSGIPRYKYSGRSQPHFDPGSLACNSQCHVLITDKVQNRVHIIDKDGKMLSVIDRSLTTIHKPVGIWVDEEDILYVAERVSGKIKAVKYLDE